MFHFLPFFLADEMTEVVQQAGQTVTEAYLYAEKLAYAFTGTTLFIGLLKYLYQKI